MRQLENVDVPLDCEQDTELRDVVSFIDQNFGNELEKLYEEADKHGVAEKLREVWMTDVQKEKAIFNRDQSQNSKRLHYQMHVCVTISLYTGTGKRFNRWSFITIRMGKYTMLKLSLYTFKLLQCTAEAQLHIKLLNLLVYCSYHQDQPCKHTLELFCMSLEQISPA